MNEIREYNYISIGVLIFIAILICLPIYFTTKSNLNIGWKFLIIGVNISVLLFYYIWIGVNNSYGQGLTHKPYSTIYLMTQNYENHKNEIDSLQKTFENLTINKKERIAFKRINAPAKSFWLEVDNQEYEYSYYDHPSLDIDENFKNVQRILISLQWSIEDLKTVSSLLRKANIYTIKNTDPIRLGDWDKGKFYLCISPRLMDRYKDNTKYHIYNDSIVFQIK